VQLIPRKQHQALCNLAFSLTLTSVVCCRPQCNYIGGAGTQCGGRTNCANGLNGDDCTPDPQNAKHGAGAHVIEHVVASHKEADVGGERNRLENTRVAGRARHAYEIFDRPTVFESVTILSFLAAGVSWWAQDLAWPNTRCGNNYQDYITNKMWCQRINADIWTCANVRMLPTAAQVVAPCVQVAHWHTSAAADTRQGHLVGGVLNGFEVFVSPTLDTLSGLLMLEQAST